MTQRRVRLFVYGTLQPQAGTRMGDWLTERLEWSTRGSVPGRLHAIRDAGGCYPALCPGKGHGRVQGMLCTLKLTSGDLARLDHYEGREYCRIALPVLTRAGHLAAQTYLWRASLPANAAHIRTGDFLEWLAATGSKPFASSR